MFEAGRVHEIVAAMLSSNRGWKEFRDDFSKSAINSWLTWTRNDEIRDNPFIRKRGFDPQQEARAFLYHVMQNYVNEVAGFGVHGSTPPRKVHAVNELSQLLGVPVPAATTQYHNQNNNWWEQYKVQPRPQPQYIRPEPAPEPYSTPWSSSQATSDSGFGFDPPLSLPPLPSSGWPLALPPPPSPPPRSESKAAKLAKLLALIAHPNTGEAERVAAMAAYQRILSEAE